MQLAGVYGFRQGKQAYAFKEDGTGFIGLDGKSKIKFNQTGNIPLAIGDDVFTVDTDGDVNLTGSVTGGSSNSGYRLDKNGSGYIRRGNYGIYFESNNYPIYISNQANSGSNASFAVDKDGNLNLRGSNIYINGDMKFNSGSLSNYVTDSELNNALSNIDISIDSEDFKSNLSQLIDSSQGLFWDSSTQKLTINASNINGKLIQGVKIKAGDIETGTLEAKNVGLDGVFTIYNQRSNDPGVHGYFGAGHGRDINNTETHGIGLTAGGLDLSDLDSGNSVAFLHSGGYIFMTNAGVRLGYREYLYENRIQHNYIVLSSNSITATVHNAYTNETHNLVFGADGTLTLDGRSL